MIKREHSALCARIGQKTSEILLGRGDYNLVGELGSLKDKLNALRKEAKQLARARAQPDHPYPSCEPVYDERLGGTFFHGDICRKMQHRECVHG